MGNSQLKFPKFGKNSSETEQRNTLGAKLKILNCGKTASNFYIMNHELIFYTEKCNSSISGKCFVCHYFDRFLSKGLRPAHNSGTQVCSLKPVRCNRGPEEEAKIKKIIVTHGKNNGGISPQEKELLVAA